MTITYDPRDSLYTDEAAVRNAHTDAFNTCFDCQRCTSYCGVFPSLFELLEAMDEPDAGLFTPWQQDKLIDQCNHCGLCSVGCPANNADDGLDMARLMLRTAAMRVATGATPLRVRVTHHLLGHVDTVGKAATSIAPFVNTVVKSESNSLLRRATKRVTGMSSIRLLSPYTKERFSTWFARRPRVRLGRPQARVTVFPTCIVEYHAPEIGQDLVKVYERNGIECGRSEVGCCGAPWLHAGDLDRFQSVADRNVRALAEEIRLGHELVVPQPTCSGVLRTAYVDHVSSPELKADAELVAEHTHDAVAYLMDLHRRDDTVLDLDFSGEIPRSVAYHLPCHLRTQDDPYASRDLLQMTGARVHTVKQCSGAGGSWSLNAANDDAASAAGAQIGATIDRRNCEAVVSDCHRASVAIVEHSDTADSASHPLQILARAYGLPAER